MLFNSYEFLLIFLPAAIVIYAFADLHDRWRTWVLVLLSLIFYSYWDVRFLPLMLASIFFNWWIARRYAETRRYALIATAIVVNLVTLAIFKYTNFFAGTFSTLFGVPLTHFSIALPLGISFFTFHHIMYLVDLGRGRAPIYPLDRYALYIAFFPQAISGPIARWNEVIDQFANRAFGPGWERRCALGAMLIVLGLLQKTMLADPLATALDPIYATATVRPPPNGESWLALGFVFQIFYDFAGYSDVAIGLALIFGIRLPLNFDAPFRASSLIDLWQRWHMTLARFLRDYVFTPLSRVRIGGGRYRMTRFLIAILLTMALCGLWHGAGWNFVIWGTLQGVGLIMAAWWRQNMKPLPALTGWTATIGYFALTAVFFRTNSLEAIWHVYQGLLVFPGRMPGTGVLLASIICAIALPPTHEICRRLAERPRVVVAVGLAGAFTWVLVVLGARESYQFAYFQF